MKFLAISSLIAAVSALPSVPAPKAQNDPNAFGVVAARSASPIHFLTLNAANSHFYLGGKAATYCPENVEKLGACPPGKETSLLGDKYLNVAVPGGQSIYVDPKGALSFTTPHSGYTPPGSSTDGFAYKPGKNGTLGSWTYKNGFMACPTSNSTIVPGNPKWQVFAASKNATVPTGNIRDCLGFSAVAAPYTGPVAAWEYI
ncbi:hypothetical protein BDV38DRAFT_89624 [Aspergillus pseudotamarii]|uniref:IgE-binding protein n=1 Tax=Aspergillus pseudotamarii TaxID=132259 RepID=A0A5N6SR20_ASPPS|nr:uncharacterized protein BDV38DRAFT_89624 [Aspergillus pseudotamarii]KAE8137138.1 hypothetical protein BDV38DRAFT_89624 [Aspergillus pseudotamarii]